MRVRLCVNTTGRKNGRKKKKTQRQTGKLKENDWVDFFVLFCVFLLCELLSVPGGSVMQMGFPSAAGPKRKKKKKKN